MLPQKITLVHVLQNTCLVHVVLHKKYVNTPTKSASSLVLRFRPFVKFDSIATMPSLLELCFVVTQEGGIAVCN